MQPHDDRPILLVEDNARDVELTLRAFKRNNVANEIIVRTDGAAALDYLIGSEGSTDPREPLPALVLLDLKLPKINGLEVLRRLRADPRTRLTPVILLTSSNEESDKHRAYDLGANSYVRKPVDFREFVEAVSRLGIYWLMVNEPVIPA